MKLNRVKIIGLAIVVLFAMIGAVHAESAVTLTREAQGHITPDMAIEMLSRGTSALSAGKP